MNVNILLRKYVPFKNRKNILLKILLEYYKNENFILTFLIKKLNQNKINNIKINHFKDGSHYIQIKYINRTREWNRLDHISFNEYKIIFNILLDILIEENFLTKEQYFLERL